jgi:predicted nuclease with RNAse H fold
MLFFIGLDLAGVETRPSGFAVLDSSMRVETMLLYSDSDILREAYRFKPVVVAIDAPLSLPRGRASLEARSNIHLRECDRELLRRGIRFFPVTLGPMRLLTKRGIVLKKALESSGFKVIEVYPGGAQDVLRIPRKTSSVNGLRKGLARFKIRGLKDDYSHHELDAITAALVAKMFYEGDYEAYGDPEEGQIIMPVSRLKRR